MSGDNDQTTTQKQEPYGPAQPYLKKAIQWNDQAFQNGMFTPQPLGGQFSDEALQSMQMTMDRANAGTPVLDSANSYLGHMLNPKSTLGIFASPEQQMGQFTKTISNDVLDEVLPAATAQFAGAGMGNSTLAMDTVGDAASTAVTNAVAPYYNAALDRTAQMQDSAYSRGMQAAGMAPSIEAAGYLPAQMVGQVGSQIDAMDEALAGADQQAFQQYLSNLGMLGGMGGISSSSQPGVSTASKVGAGGLTGLGTYGLMAANAIPGAAPLAIGAGLLGML